MGCELLSDASSSSKGEEASTVYLAVDKSMPARMLLRLPESDMGTEGLSEFILSTAALVITRSEVERALRRLAR